MMPVYPPALDVPGVIAAGMGPEVHWFPEDVPVTRLAAVLAGMANTRGGTVILGVAPRSREIIGISQHAEVMDRVFQAELLADPPLVLPVPRLVPVAKSRVLIISVPSGLPYVYCVDGRYWGREITQTNPLTARKLRELLIVRGIIQFESRTPPGVSLNDLDMEQVLAYVQALNIPGDDPPEEILFRRGCLQRVEGKYVPTYAGLLLFGRFPQQYLPNATLLAARFPGVTFSDQFVKQEMTGTLPQQLHQAENFLKNNLNQVVRLVRLVHEESLEYPFESVRELLVNAVAHRDYNLQGDNIHLYIFTDRLEVHSPGGLPGPVTLENLLEARFSRNAVITQVLSDLGFVERLGYGLDRVVAAMREVGMSPPRFEELAGTFRVTLFNDLPRAGIVIPEADLSVYARADLNPRQKVVLQYLTRQRRITNRDFQALYPEVHAETLRRDLAYLVSKGILVKIGDKKSTYYILK